MFQNDLIDPNKHGFTLVGIQLLTVMEHWTQSLDSGICMDMIYLDITKAFDSIQHVWLLTFEVIVWNGLATYYLIGRNQWVVFNGCKFNQAPSYIRSGISQGTILAYD